MKDIIKKGSGYSDEMMYNHCCMLASVVNQTVEKTVGRGKAKHTEVTLKHKTDLKTIERINNSVEHYKNKMGNKFKLRDYQESIAKKATKVIIENGFVYLTMEVRTGKTFTSLATAELLKSKKVLFVTKKKAISSIQSDYDLMSPDFEIMVINYESLHKVEAVETYDLVVLDEAHGMGAFPKPSGRAKLIRGILGKSRPNVILLSGTPTPESYSQMYHQVYGIGRNPFSAFSSFYKFAKSHINVTQRKINGFMVNDYSKGLDSIMEAMKPYIISYSQKEAGFKVDTREHIFPVKMLPITYKIASKLKKDLVVQGKDDVILADTPVKLMMKLHQIYSGTVKFESGSSTVLDYSKAQAIFDGFGDSKIGIFYKFKEELNALKEIYGDDITTELSVFENTNKSIALQIVSGREGISLRQAKALVYYNIDFSATSYWQSRDRMTTSDRLESDIYWVFAEGGIENDIYKAVSKKKDYTLAHYKRDNK